MSDKLQFVVSLPSIDKLKFVGHRERPVGRSSSVTYRIDTEGSSPSID